MVQGNEVKVAQSCLTLCDPMDYTIHRLLQARILEWVGSSQPRNQTQVRRILYRLSHKRSPRILEWVAQLFSRGFSRPRNRTRVSFIENSLLTEISGKSSSMNHGGSWKHQFIKIGHFLVLLSLRHWTKNLNQGSHPNLGSFYYLLFLFPLSLSFIPQIIAFFPSHLSSHS